MKNKQGKFDTWMLRVRLLLLQMNVFTADNVEENTLHWYWESLYDADFSPIDAIREQGIYNDPPVHENEEYRKYLNQTTTK